jgi:hypothetical protein
MGENSEFDKTRNASPQITLTSRVFFALTSPSTDTSFVATMGKETLREAVFCDKRAAEGANA